MGGLVPPLLSLSTALRLLLPVALALPLLMRDTRVLLAPADDGMRRVLAPLPSAAEVAMAVVFALALSWLLVRRDPSPRPFWTPLLGLLVAAAPLVPLLSGHGLLLGVFQGPVMVAVAAALLAATLARAVRAGAWRWVMPPARGALFFVSALAVFALALTRLPGPAGAQGDEPHYLLMAHSLWTDGDVDLADDLRAGDYRPFYAGVLRAHASPASAAGRVLPVHAPGLSVLAAPFYAWGGEAAVRLLMAVLAALAATLAALAVRDVTGRAGLAWAAWAALVLTPPLPFYAVSIYPEVVAALATALFLHTAHGSPSPGRLLAATVVAATLPWVHPKFLPLAAGGLLLVLLRPVPSRRRWAAAVIALGGWGGLLAYFFAVYGSASLSAAYGTGASDDVALWRAPWGGLALLLDRQFGLLAVSPVWLLALPGAVGLSRWRPGDALRAVLLAGLAAGVGASFSMWWGGSCPPARFVVPALPALALLAVLAFARSPVVAAALAGLGASVVALAMDAPRAIHNRADADSGLLRYLAPQLDLDGFLPSFVAATDARLDVKLLTAALALALLATAMTAWSRHRVGVALAVAATTMLASSTRGPAPLLDPLLSPLRLMESWDPQRSWSPQRARALDGVVVPLDLGAPAWDLAPGDLRVSRRLDLPPGVYRLRLDAEASGEPRSRLLKIEVVADDVLLEKLFVTAGGAAPEVQLVLPVGVRRLQVVAAAVQGAGRVRSAVLSPVVVVPGPERQGLEWPRLGHPDRYRVGDVVKVTALDRGERQGETFEVRGTERFAIDAPPGAPVRVTVEDGVDVSMRWAGRDVLMPAGQHSIVVPAEGVALGRLVVVPVTVSGRGRVRFDLSPG